MRNKKAFTLVEVLAVITLLGILLLVAVPSIGKLITKSKQRAFAEDAVKFLTEIENRYNSDLSIDTTSFSIENEFSEERRKSPFDGKYKGTIILESSPSGNYFKIEGLNDSKYKIDNSNDNCKTIEGLKIEKEKCVVKS